ncbi:MAG: hypothetical protein K2X51_04390 [Burkholderiales bacterium]|nr:MAG: hypothetical protein F9K21_01860 [Rhodocyclaceae bacterium]MBX9610844.1 hypothetical protein [Burkholderiales bacterium]CAG0927624.1 hypothetical protein RHDC3_00483 [Rhodocyclaceae bacterium]
MTIKELAYSTQQHLQTATGAQFKRAHIYELLAASFGFNSYAALSSDAVFTKDSLTNRRTSKYVDHVKDRCLEIGYDTNTADVVAASLPRLLTEQEIGVIRIPDLIAHLRYEPGHGDWNEDEEEDDWELVEDERLAVTEALISPLLIDGLTNAAAKGNATAHFALALIHADDDIDDVETGSDYWYQQAQSGRVLAGVEKEWADSHEARLNREQLFARHLKEAARLGCPEALLELADRFDDPAFFEQATSDVNADPAWVAEIAERLGRREDSKKWLTEAAKCGDTEAMRQLIEEFDHGDLVRCWTWLYLAEMLGSDLTKDDYHAIHEDGSPYDDDVGGPIFADGRDGVRLEPISADQQATARQNAAEMFRVIRDDE